LNVRRSEDSLVAQEDRNVVTLTTIDLSECQQLVVPILVVGFV
jgi:hypothetical protein